MALKKRKSDAGKIEPGMNVEALQGDLGEADVSKPKVTDVALDAQGNVEKLVVEKGVIFKKKLEIPADHVKSVDPDSGNSSPQGKVTVDVGRQETQSLKATDYGRWLAALATVALIITNVALIAADLVAIGSGLELITKVSWVWFVAPVAALLWYITVYRNFASIKKIFIVLSLVFVTYIVTAIFSGANWGAVLVNTFVPHISFGFASISSAVALLGATFSPYSMFWQVRGEKEQKRPGSTKQQLRSAGLDIASGVISGNLVAYFIIVCTSATIFIHHGQINTAVDAAKALQPLLGPFATYLFAIGLIGSGVIAIPILLASTSYAVAGTFGWPGALSKKPWQNEGFYFILTVALIASLALALLRFNPIQLIFWANVLAGVLAPVLVALILLVGNNRKIMRNARLSLLTNIGLVIALLILVAGAALLFYGLATGQSS